MTLLISDLVWKDIINYGELNYPEECCGFVLGNDLAENRSIEYFLPVHNVQIENRKRRFKIAPHDYLNAERKAAELGLSVLGIYHTHPDHPARPSEHDRIHAMPFFSYLIASIRSSQFDRLTSWRLNDHFDFEEEDIAVSRRAQMNEIKS